MARSREKERDNGRRGQKGGGIRGNDISIFILCGYFFSSIHGIIATINEGGDRFRFGRLDTKEGETKTFASRL